MEERKGRKGRSFTREKKIQKSTGEKAKRKKRGGGGIKESKKKKQWIYKNILIRRRGRRMQIESSISKEDAD